MKIGIALVLILFTPVSALAECMAIGIYRQPGDRPPPRPKYKIVECVPASEVIEPQRAANPLDYTDFRISDEQKALLVEPVNWTAEFYLGGSSRYWAYEGSCDEIKLHRNFTRVDRDIVCCDIYPLRSVQCGLGGTKVLNIRYSWFG